MPRTPISTLFPYTTLFRSEDDEAADLFEVLRDQRRDGHVQRRTGAVDRKSTRLNSSHLGISYGFFCLKKYHTRTSRCDTPYRHTSDKSQSHPHGPETFFF